LIDFSLEVPIETQVNNLNLVKSINNKMLLFNNEILKIGYTFDKKKQIFGSSVGSLIVRDIHKGKMKVITNHLMDNRAWVRGISKDSLSHYWIATSNQLSVFDSNFRILKAFFVKQHVSFYGHLETFFMSSDRRIGYWWTSREHLAVIDINKRKFLYTISKMVDGKF